MNGIEMMMKSMGFDPIVIRSQVESAVQQLRAAMDHFDSRLNSIDKRLSHIEIKLYEKEDTHAGITRVE